MSDSRIHPVSASAYRHAVLHAEDHRRLYRQSVEQPERFWAEQARHFLDWFKPWRSVHHGDFARGQASWFKGGQLNAAYNCLDRHLAARGEPTALIWEGDEPGQCRQLSYRELHDEVCRLANVLRQLGVGKGDRVCIYLPMIPEAAYAMLACARIGAVHSVVFGGFAPTRCASASSTPTAGW